MELRVDLEDFDGEKGWANYDLFHIEDSAGKYRLKIWDYQGNAGDDLSFSNNAQFSTKDADHDSYTSGNCAEVHKGAWWYKKCSSSNLNGFQHRGFYERSSFGYDGIFWTGFRIKNYSLKSTQLSVRPRFHK
ncbi:UNVERIFIED_CONTAM: hypothetical protein GTU68_009868 [Idotea baltica]|nr:hypothetical protein [Idotea baltica]